ncbi:P-loop containing nucleoside triphosphate hydrolase protein [Xylariales sp. AK1849]|nr:P-loop containing nucleoside triphosphate hydrolase protein [Xylariales sp. AK1849]
MDYQSINGRDISSFDLPSTHRLPTVSAAAALEELRTDRSCFVSTGLDALDQTLNPVAVDMPQGSAQPGGFQKGQVVELWGPPGSGKTNFGLQLASDALSKGAKVVWVDALRPVSGTRLHGILDDNEAPTPSVGGIPTKEEQVSNLIHFTCPSLAHFIALLCRPTSSCIPQDASLVVIDSLSALVNQAFPKVREPRNTPKGGLNTSTRRLQLLQSIVSSLQKLAATRDILIVILSHCVTRMQAERGATLIPAINASSWEQGIATRLVLFKDWSFRNDVALGVHFAKLQKLNGKTYAEGLGPVFAFDILAKGLVSVEYNGTQPSLTLSSTPLPKRKLGETDFEIADSEDEYGWEDEDATKLPPNPSQWQGSEDLLLGEHDEEGNRKDESADDYSAHSDQSQLSHHDNQDLDDGDGRR